MSPTSDDEFIYRVAAELADFGDAPLCGIEFGPRSAMVLIAMLELALRHPGNIVEQQREEVRWVIESLEHALRSAGLNATADMARACPQGLPVTVQ